MKTREPVQARARGSEGHSLSKRRRRVFGAKLSVNRLRSNISVVNSIGVSYFADMLEILEQSPELAVVASRTDTRKLSII